jgi:hypothetical protein
MYVWLWARECRNKGSGSFWVLFACIVVFAQVEVVGYSQCSTCLWHIPRYHFHIKRAFILESSSVKVAGAQVPTENPTKAGTKMARFANGRWFSSKTFAMPARPMWCGDTQYVSLYKLCNRWQRSLKYNWRGGQRPKVIRTMNRDWHKLAYFTPDS